MDYFKDLLDYTTDYWINGVEWVATVQTYPHLRLPSELFQQFSDRLIRLFKFVGR